eukprot:1133860-Pyramimonas_sp.AAC.2
MDTDHMGTAKATNARQLGHALLVHRCKLGGSPSTCAAAFGAVCATIGGGQCALRGFGAAVFTCSEDLGGGARIFEGDRHVPTYSTDGHCAGAILFCRVGTEVFCHQELLSTID